MIYDEMCMLRVFEVVFFLFSFLMHNSFSYSFLFSSVFSATFHHFFFSMFVCSVLVCFSSIGFGCCWCCWCKNIFISLFDSLLFVLALLLFVSFSFFLSPFTYISKRKQKYYSSGSKTKIGIKKYGKSEMHCWSFSAQKSSR